MSRCNRSDLRSRGLGGEAASLAEEKKRVKENEAEKEQNFVIWARSIVETKQSKVEKNNEREREKQGNKNYKDVDELASPSEDANC